MQDSLTNNPQTFSGTEDKRMYLQIADKLAQIIKSGEIQPGERLSPERELASRYDVSRQTVREALIALEVSGLVAIKPGSGIYVLKSDSLKTSILKEDAPGPLEIMEARLLFEAQAAELAADRISNEELLRLKAYLNQMANMVEEHKVAEAEAFDGKFHQLIAGATRNSAIASTIEWLWAMRDSSEISRVFSEKVRNMGANPSIKAHEKIYQCLCRRDGPAAKAAMQEHLSQVVEEYVLVISD